MAYKEQDNRIFVGGLSREVSDRQLEQAFARFGKIVDCQVMLERDTGRPRGFGFLTFADRDAMEDAIRGMNDRELGDRVITVNKAQPRMSGDDSGQGGYGGHSSGAPRGNYAGGDRSAAGPDDCFKCGRSGHWARDCPSAGGGGRGARPFSPPRSKYGGGSGARGDRYAGDRDRYADDRYGRGRFGDRDRYDSRDDRYGGRDPYISDRYVPAADRLPVGRHGASERYPHNGFGKDRGAAYDRVAGGGGGPASRYEGRSYRERPGPYDNPRRGGRAPSLDRY